MKKLFVSVLVVASFLLCATSCKKEQLSLSRDSSISVTVSEAAALNTKSSAQETLVLESLDPDAPVLYMTGEDYIPSSEASATKASAVNSANFASRYPQFTMDAIMGGERYMDNVAVRYTDEKWKIDPDSEGVPYHWVWNEATGKYKTIRFWAYASAVDRSKILSQSQSGFIFTHEVPGDQDLLVATQSQNSGEVTLKFYHALAAFGGYADHEPDEGIELLGYSFDGMYTSGTCACHPMVGMGGMLITWSCDEGVDTKGSYSGTFRSGEYSFNQNDYIFAIPSLNDDSKLTLKYKKGGVEKTSSYLLKGIEVKAGMKYIFRLEYPNTATLLDGTLFRDKVAELVPGKDIKTIEFKTGTELSSYPGLPYTEVQDNLKKGKKIYAVYDASVKKLSVITYADNMYSNTSMFRMFWGSTSYSFTNVESIDLGTLNTINTTDMSETFRGLGKLTSIKFDKTRFNTSNVTTMNSMFASCSSLPTVDVTGFNTANVTNMGSMFNGCAALHTLDVSGFNTGSVSAFYSMFCDCGNLETIDVSHFNTVSAANMSKMFQGCRAVRTLDVSNFQTSMVTLFSYMFEKCGQITELDLRSFSTNAATDLRGMFADCPNLKTIRFDSSKFTTPKVTDMSYMFKGCGSLDNLDVTSVTTANVTTMASMFEGCSSMKTLDVTRFNTEKVESMGQMFRNCVSLSGLDVAHFNTTKVTNMASMFENCLGLTSLDLSSFNTSSVVNLSTMLSECQNIQVLKLGAYFGVPDGAEGKGHFNFMSGCGRNVANATLYCPDSVWNELVAKNTGDYLVNMGTNWSHQQL